MNCKSILTAIILSSFLFSCTKLDEDVDSAITGDQADQLFGGANPDVSALLEGAYIAMRNPYQDQSQVWAAGQHTTDETIGPTRGGDWDDNGVWRVLHSHQWDADHSFLADAYRNVGRVVFATTDLLKFNPPASQASQARYLRAFASFTWLDGWDQVPYREPGGDLADLPQVRKGSEALDWIISELTAIIPDLPDGPAYLANKDAARTLLMKCYLNKGVYANRASPSFDAADMQQVITYADQMINSGKYQLQANFYDNFAPTNDAISKENIWTGENRGGSSSGNVRFYWFCTLHYNNNPSGWNGFTTLSDFYDKFEATDTRRGASYTGVTNVSGIRVGLLEGQQYDQNGVALKDRKNNPLAFTREVKLKETGNNLEVTGIRVIKYPIDYGSGDNVNNDFVYFRYADVLLMKAEALLRTNDAAGALTLVNQLRTIRGASTLGSVDLNQLLDERSRELYWEGWRRNDLVRFGKFLDAWQEKGASGPERLLFPIPNRSLAANPNLVQNPGY
ncbi:RagB/SusD family nutrient uptake outer membrane protein [Flavihumibacter solisilvae]|uniref:Carbohydrate-binding protein SusD n=1 Tax=Flavihumibacter solisilvae TaxID=1349421 RepID=A0A0C1KYW7_9BACT|nr:RagB/SusD family nutrient uptake outer membrane protein [Flavihumibacter solisilvae]KIC92887.1 carbohydrate-binding protein SusD [Flavihumibacter solisilvae]